MQHIRDLLSINISQCKEQSYQKPTRIVESFVWSAMYLKCVCNFNIIVIFPPSTDNHIMYIMILEWHVSKHSLFRIVVFTTKIWNQIILWDLLSQCNNLVQQESTLIFCETLMITVYIENGQWAMFILYIICRNLDERISKI